MWIGFAIGVVLSSGFWLLLMASWPEASQRLHDAVQRKLEG